MGIKKTLGFGVATAALGLTLIGGGTFAYFSDSVETTGTFAAGTLDLNADRRRSSTWATSSRGIPPPVRSS